MENSAIPEIRQAFSLDGRVAVVIGGTSGIGEAITQAFSDAGAKVVPSSRRRDAVAAAAAALGRRQDKTLVCTVDVDNPDSIAKLQQRVMDTFGRVDILVNSAGVHRKESTLSTLLENWDGVLKTNLTGTFIASQVFGKVMLSQSFGRIINVASLGSFVALHEATAYCVSKAGVLALTRCLGTEWAKQGVTVNAIVPGVFRTAINQNALSSNARLQEILVRTPMFRLGHVHELGAAAVFLASEGSSFMTGQALIVDGGYLAAGITANSIRATGPEREGDTTASFSAGLDAVQLVSHEL